MKPAGPAGLAGPVIIPERHNYIAVFLTLACNLKCSYCINHFGEDGPAVEHLDGEEWVEALNRIESRPDLPLTLQGGEPSLHKDFIYILNNIKPTLAIDILTNLQFDADEFIANVDPARIKRDSPYASIRVSYHPEVMELKPLAEKVLKLQKAGFSIGIWGVMHPAQEAHILESQKYCKGLGIDFRLKEFLGEYKGKMYGTYRYEGACERRFARRVECRTSELIVGGDGGVYRCHSDLYEGRPAIGNITKADFEIDNAFRGCDFFGQCNPCDIKVKTNRLQEFGHTSVEISGGDDA
jgi:MoaA/NifB/PqqE/SkfB family radical SAM enzyme